MTLGDWIVAIITWGTFAGGCWALISIAKRRIGPQIASIVSSFVARDYVTYEDEPALSEPVCPRTDAPADGRTEPQAPIATPVTLDTAKSLRAHGYTRDEARALLKTLGYTLGNDVWAAAKPVATPTDDDALVTPYAGRVTKRSYYPDTPELEYREPTT